MTKWKFGRCAMWMGLILAAVVATAMVAEAFETKVTDAAVFKNGYAFVLREGECEVEGGGKEGLWSETKQVPQALLGTFWAYSLTDGVKVTEIKSGEQEVKEKVVARSLEELLIANLGKPVNIKTSYFTGGEEKEREVQGVLVFAAGRWLGEETQLGAAAGTDTSGYYRPPSPAEPMLVLKTEEGLVTLRGYQFNSVFIPGASPEEMNQFERAAKERRMKVVLEGQVEKGMRPRVGLAYMTKGIRWLPAYEISLLDDKTCRLRLQANVVNDIEDLEGTTLHFVVGVPHFVMSDTLSPLSLREAFQGLSSYFQAAGTRAGAAMGSQMAAYGGGAYGGGYGPAGPPAPVYAALPPGAAEGLVPGPLPSPFEETGQLPTAGAEDLFLYKKENVWLKKGERAMLDIFQAEVPYSHLYQWEITGDEIVARREESRRQPTPEELAAELLKDKVWHCLRLENKTEMPWTTAPAMTMREWRPLGQDMLNYTAVGDKATVKITIATDIGAKKQEEEIDRQRQALQVWGEPYDLVTVRGTLSLENSKKDEVAMEVSRTLTGEIKETSDQAKTTRGGYTLRGLNPTSTVKWEFELQPAEKKELTYVFAVYVQSRY